ncbi:hypothetical protein EYR38_004992 [Pleurotus pulmonarius]|nr:hypothetical protein EYR38_004992 [Pleurotus pulmonarius]
MSDSSPIRIPFTSSPSPSPPPESHAHENEAHEGHSRSLPLPPSHLPSHIHPSHSQTLPLRLTYPMATDAPQQLVPAPDFPTYYPPLPSDHPPLPPHTHAPSSKKCPFAATHEFCPPQEGDVRSPCPALNTMANHGYINRSGKNLTAAALTSALQKCYNLSLPLAIVLSYGGFILLHRYNFLRPIDLKEVGKHGYVEHDASLVHRDTILGDAQGENDNQNANGRTLAETTPTKPRSPIKRLTASLSLPALPLPLKKEKKPVYYAPTEIVPEWVDALMLDARMLREDEEWAFKIMARDQQEFALGEAKEKERSEEKGKEQGEEKGEKGEGRKLGQNLAPLNIGNTRAHVNGTPANTPSAPVIEPSPSGDGYDVTMPAEHTAHAHMHTASDASAPSSLSSSAHSTFSSALGFAFLPMSAGAPSTAATTPAQTAPPSPFGTVNAHGPGKSLRVSLAMAGLDASAGGGAQNGGSGTVIVDEHEVVASPTTMTASQTLGRTLPTSNTNTNPNTPPESSTHRTLLTAASVSLSRIRREAHSLAHSTLTRAGGAGRTGTDGKVQGIDAVHAEIARGEMAIVLGMWEVEDYPGVRAASLGAEKRDGAEGEIFPGVGRAVARARHPRGVVPRVDHVRAPAGRVAPDAHAGAARHDEEEPGGEAGDGAV